MNKNAYECPACGALLSLVPPLRACPVCDHLLTDDDRAAWPPLEEEQHTEAEDE